MDPTNESSLVVAYLNNRGQTGLPISKQKQIEDFVKLYNIDILHCQEIDIQEDTFRECNYLISTYNIVPNNSQNRYGTASLIRNELNTENLNCDTNGRVISFNINEVTFTNLYMPSGNDPIMRTNRENYFAEKIPQILINGKSTGCIGGDFNCILSKDDATKNPDNKMSPSLKKLVQTFSWKDSFRVLHPKAQIFSRYYESAAYGEGATRIDRNYNYGDLKISEAKYVPVAFSDHMSHIILVELPDSLSLLKCHKTCPLFKLKPIVAVDPDFKERLANSMVH